MIKSLITIIVVLIIVIVMLLLKKEENSFPDTASNLHKLKEQYLSDNTNHSSSRDAEIFPPAAKFPISSSSVIFAKFDAELIPYGSFRIPNAHPKNERNYRNVHRLMIKGKFVPGYFSDDYVLTHNGLYITRIYPVQKDDGYKISSSEIIGINLYDATFTLLEKDSRYIYAFRGSDGIYCTKQYVSGAPVKRLQELRTFMKDIWSPIFDGESVVIPLEAYYLEYKVHDALTNVIIRNKYSNEEFITYQDVLEIEKRAFIHVISTKDNEIIDIEKVIQEEFIEKRKVLTQILPIKKSLPLNEKVYRISPKLEVGTHFLTTIK